jgi:signal recognition particle receptor subunit beta
MNALAVYVIDPTRLPTAQQVLHTAAQFLTSMKEPRFMVVLSKADLCEDMKDDDKKALEKVMGVVYDVLGPLGVRRSFVSAKSGVNMEVFRLELGRLLYGLTTSDVVLRNEKVKLVVLGPRNVGKSTFLYCASKCRAPGLKLEATLGLDLSVVELKKNDQPIGKVFLWDTAGQERFGSLTKNYLHDADIVLIFRDARDVVAKIPQKDAEFQRYLKLIEDDCHWNPAIVPVFTKADLLDDPQIAKGEFFFSTSDPGKIHKFVCTWAAGRLRKK